MKEPLLDRVWEYREELLYPSFFGNMGPGIYTIPRELFTEVFRHEPDARWLHIGVLASPPGEKHDDWVYITSGLSNPWEADVPPPDPAQPSWLGVELMFRSTEGGDWAIQMPQKVAAFELLLAHGRYPGKERLGIGHRIPIRAPLVPGAELTWLVVCPPALGPERLQLESGVVDILQIVAVSEAEVRLAREQGLDELIALLRWADAYAVTNPRRRSLLGA